MVLLYHKHLEVLSSAFSASGAGGKARFSEEAFFLYSVEGPNVFALNPYLSPIGIIDGCCVTREQILVGLNLQWAVFYRFFPWLGYFLGIIVLGATFFA